MHYNARSLVKHDDKLKEFIDLFNTNFSIIGVTETWERQTAKVLDLEGYECFSQYRQSKRGGGCCIFIKKDLSVNYKLRTDLSIFDEGKIETVFIELLPKKGKNIIIGTVYRPPGAKYSDSSTLWKIL